MRLAITRPLDDAAPLAARLRGAGHQVIVAPLMEIVAIEGGRLDLATVQALALTSANGAREAARRLEPAAMAAVPVFAVGDATARVAREAGFAQVEAAGGDVDKLAELIVARCDPAAGPIAHPSGKDRAGDLAGELKDKGFSVLTVALYKARAAQWLPAELATALERRKLDGVLLYSPRTARIYAALVGRAGLQGAVEGVTHFCLSEAVREALAPLQLASARSPVAASPRQDALLTLVDAHSAR